MTRQLQVFAPAGGWLKVLDTFNRDYAQTMLNNPLCHMVLVVDFDARADRFDEVTSRVPTELRSRTFVLGSLTDPERLRSKLGRSFEQIGKDLARDCKYQTNTVWGHELLMHNASELSRLQTVASSILFPAG